jgi:carbon monoxide dehydrogenase subunit G
VVIEEHTQIAAPVARVWALVSDPDRMSVLSPEVHHIDWTGELGGSSKIVGCRISARAVTSSGVAAVRSDSCA